MKSICILIALTLTTFAFNVNSQLPAFPGAEGFGKFTTGGRTGTVYHVTNLNDTGPGSFRDAVSQPNRIVVFDVGGIINITTRIVISKNVTIAGQTAPGGGITIYGNGIALTTSSGNNIIRYIRIRMGKNGESGKDAVGISGGQDYMFDHVSISWGRDGTLDVNGTGIDNLSFQECIIGQGINNSNHSTGGLMQSGKWSVIRSLYIDNKTRNPKARGSHEFINSVLYNWGTNGYIMGDTEGLSECNLVGNYFIYGPSSSGSTHITNTTPSFHVYASDNWVDNNKDGNLNGTLMTSYSTATVETNPYDYPGVENLLSAADAIKHIVQNVGASMSRDAVDAYLIDQLVSYGKNGAIINTEDDNGIAGNVGTVANGTPPTDTDGDGMPDEWEDANGTDKDSDDAMTIGGNGYANIENYINSIPVLQTSYILSPSDIKASEIESDNITLTWSNKEEGADKIIIEYGKALDNFDKSIEVSGDKTTATISELSTNTTYYFRLKTVKGEEESSFSWPIEAKTQESAAPPKASISPIPANGSTLSFNKNIVLTWDNISSSLGGTLQYEVYFGTSEPLLEKVASTENKMSYNVGDLQIGTTYYWRIKTTNTKGSNEGSVWSFTISDDVQKLLYLPFDETTGTTANNATGENDAIANNLTPGWVAGLENNSVFFDVDAASVGALLVNNYSAIEMGTKPFSISFYYKSNGGGVSDVYLFHKGTHSSSSGPLGSGKWIGLQYKKGERLTFAIDDNVAKSSLDISSPDKYFDNKWHHMVCIRDVAEDKLKVYIDGVLAGSTTDGTGDITELAEFVIGNCNFNFNTPYVGNLDEFVLFNRVLTEAEIQYLYSSKFLTERYSEEYEVGIPEIPREKINIVPNPFSEEFSFVLNGPFNITRVNVELYDLTGRKVFSEYFTSSSSEITVSNLPSLSQGIYTCVIKSENKTYTTKIMKQ